MFFEVIYCLHLQPETEIYLTVLTYVQIVARCAVLLKDEQI